MLTLRTNVLSFTDHLLRTWPVEPLTRGEVESVRVASGGLVDLARTLDGPEVMTSLLGDPVLAAKVLWVVLEPLAAARGVGSFADFVGGLDAVTLRDGVATLLDAAASP